MPRNSTCGNSTTSGQGVQIYYRVLPDCHKIGSATGETTSELVSQSFIEHLTNASGNDKDVSTARVKRRKVSCPPRRSLSAEDVAGVLSANLSRKAHKKRTSGHTATNASCSTSTMAEHVAESIASDTSAESETENGEDMSFTGDNSSDSDVEADSVKSTHEELQMTEGDHVIILYKGRQYPGKVKQVKKPGAQVTCMESRGSNCKWPKKPDELYYHQSDIII